MYRRTTVKTLLLYTVMSLYITLLGGQGISEQRRQGERRLIITTLLEPPYMMLKKDSPFLTGNDRFEGYIADMITRLATGLGFVYELRLARDGKYGDKGENNSWTGMIGELVRGEADLAAGPLIVTDPRAEVVAFTDPFLEFRYTAVIKKPKKRKPRIKNPEQLLDSNLPYGLVRNSIAQELFRKTNNSTYQRMWGRMATFWPSAFVQNTQEGIERARREKYAFILNSPAAEYISNKRPCDLHTIEPFLDIQKFSLALRKNDRIRERINRELRRMVSNQDMTSIYLKWWHGECHHKGGRGFGSSRPRGARTESHDGSRGKGKGYQVTTEPNPWRYATAGAIKSGQSTAINFCAIKFLYVYSIVLILHLFMNNLNLIGSHDNLFMFVIK